MMSVFGVIGVLIAVFLVKSLNTQMLQWVVLVVLLYSAVSLFMAGRKESEA